MATTRERQALKAFDRYSDQERQSIFQAYGRPSDAKIKAWFDICHDAFECESPSTPSVITHNTCFFTCGFTHYERKTDTLYFHYYTPYWNIVIPI